MRIFRFAAAANVGGKRRPALSPVPQRGVDRFPPKADISGLGLPFARMIASPRCGKPHRFDPAGFPSFGSEDPKHEATIPPIRPESRGRINYFSDNGSQRILIWKRSAFHPFWTLAA